MCDFLSSPTPSPSIPSSEKPLAGECHTVILLQRDQVASRRFANQEVAHSNIHSNVSVEAVMHVYTGVRVQACNYICVGVHAYVHVCARAYVHVRAHASAV